MLSNVTPESYYRTGLNVAARKGSNSGNFFAFNSKKMDLRSYVRNYFQYLGFHKHSR